MNVQIRTKWSGDEVIAENSALAVVSAGKLVEALLNKALLAEGLTLARLALLHRLTADGALVGVKDLAAALGCAKSNASVLVEKMQRDGLVDRAVDPADRRGVLVGITAAGERALTAGLEVVGRTQNVTFADFSAEERQVLARLLSRVAA